MGINLGDEIPNFKANSSVGSIDFHQWLGDSWGILFSHPNDYTPVCTTELARMAHLVPEFKKRQIKIIAMSCNDVDTHTDWIKDIEAYGELDPSSPFPYPILADPTREIAISLGMLDPVEKDSEGMPLAARAVFIVDDKKKLRLSILYPATTGRNFDEILRVVDSLFLTEYKKVATPVDWKNGDACVILPSVSNDSAHELFPQGFETVALPSKKEYIRFVKDV